MTVKPLLENILTAISPIRNALPGQQLSASVGDSMAPPATRASTRALQQVGDALRARGWTTYSIAGELHRRGEKCTQSKAAKILKGRVRLRVDVLEHLAEMAGLTLVELLHDPKREFADDLTPIEARLLARFRDLRGELQLALLNIVTVLGEKPLARRKKRDTVAASSTHLGIGADPYGDLGLVSTPELVEEWKALRTAIELVLARLGPRKSLSKGHRSVSGPRATKA